MYNEQIKSAFIQKYTTSDKTKKLLLHIFDGTKDAEEKYGRDFYEMDVEQAQETYNRISGIKVAGASATLMILKAYVRWCRANGYHVSDAVDRLRIDVYEKIKDSYVASPQHLLRAMDEAFPHPEKNEIEYIYRSFFWLGFMGFQVNEAIQVKDYMLDFKRLVLVYPDRDAPYRIYSESVGDLRKAVELKEFKDPRPGEASVKKRTPGHEILRGKVSKNSLADVVERTFRPTISRAFKAAVERYAEQRIEVPVDLSLKLSYKHVYMSGIFYRTYERERMGLPPDFGTIVVEERRNAKEPSFSRNYTERKLLNILIRNIEQDYNNWKSVFS